ncbi:hypothetical protein LJR186_002864 [Microbacterium foliorum]
MTGRRGRRVLAGVAGAALLLGIGMAPSAQMTEAAFTDSDHARTTITALRLAPPQITGFSSCIRPPVLGGSFMKIVFQWPNAAAPYSTMTSANVQWRVGTTVIAPVVTGPDAQGRYTADITTGLLSGLLGSLLGADVILEMRTTYSGWTSPGVTTATYNAPLIAGAPTCTPANGV